MIEIPDSINIFIFVIGILIAASMWIKTVSDHYDQSPIAGYIILGILLRSLDNGFTLFIEESQYSLELLGEIGIIVLLFKTGLECHYQALKTFFSKAALIAPVNIIGSGIVGFVAAYYLIGFSLIPSLFIATALTATSIGVVLGSWDSAGALEEDEGKLLIAMASLDDLIGVALMALLLEIAPILHAGDSIQYGTLLLQTTGIFALKFGFFVTLCYFFSTWVEPWLMSMLKRYEEPPERLITVLTNSFLIAALSAYFDFSLAIGAFFAGLAFSHDPEMIKMRSGFRALEDLFTPFFFINIGFLISLENITALLVFASLILFIAAVIGKGFFVFLASRLRHIPTQAAVLLGVSMIPRAEITMVIMQQGALLGEWAAPRQAYDSMVLVTLFTCMMTPFILFPLIKRKYARYTESN